MAFLPAVLAVGGSVIQGVSAIQQGNAQAAAAKVEGQSRADELARDAQYTKIAAEQSQASRLDQLQRTTGTIRATMASRNLDPNSPSAGALDDAATGYANRDIMRANFNAEQQIGNDKLTGQTALAMANFKAKAARNAGYMSAAGSLFKAATTANSAFG